LLQVLPVIIILHLKGYLGRGYRPYQLQNNRLIWTDDGVAKSRTRTLPLLALAQAAAAAAAAAAAVAAGGGGGVGRLLSDHTQTCHRLLYLLP